MLKTNNLMFFQSNSILNMGMSWEYKIEINVVISEHSK